MTQSVQNRIVAEGIGYIVIDGLQQAIALAALPVLLVLLAPAEFGLVTWGLVWMQLALAVGTLGLDFALLRHFEGIAGEARPGTNARVLSLSVAAAAGTAALAGTVTAAVNASPVTTLMVWTGTAVGLILAVRAVPLAILRAERDVRRYGVLMLGAALLQAVGQIVGTFVRPDAVGYMAGYVLATAAGLVWALVVTGNRFDWRQLGRWPDASLVRYAFAVLPSALFNRVLASADRFALFHVQDLATLGTYGLAARLSLPLKMIGGGFKTALAPSLGQAEQQKQEPGALLLPFGGFVTRLLLFGSAVLLLGLELLELTPWAGTTAAEVEWLLALLLVAQMAGVLAALLQVAVYFSAYPGRAGLAGGISAGVLLVCVMALVPTLGARGAALSQVAASITALALQTWWLHGIAGLGRRVSRWALASALPVLVVAIGTAWGPRALFWGKIVFAVVAAGALAPDLHRLRGFVRSTH